MSKLRTNKSGIESFVEGYLAKYRNSNNKRAVRRFVEKAIIQINSFINPPCCDDPDAVTGHGRRSDGLNMYLHATLDNKFNRRKYGKSLDRTLTLLNNFLNPPCCP
jgi:hypothetical protein